MPKLVPHLPCPQRLLLLDQLSHRINETKRASSNPRHWREQVMKKTALALFSLFLFASTAQAQGASTSQAQVMVDVAKITCDQFVEYKIADPKQIATWISGFYHGAQGSTVVDTQEILEATTAVEQHCFKHPRDLVMRSFEIAMGAH
jgi:acid stress chaperone HdeB